MEPAREERETFLDIGSGAGFPGMVFKVACPQIPVTLIEPRKNRFFFLKHIARSLDLDGIRVLNVRLEEKSRLPELAGSRFSMITSRAFTDIGRFVRLASPYLAPEGRIVLMKGPGAVAELNDLDRGDLPAQFYVAEKKRLRLPVTRAERWLISMRKAGGKLL